MDSKNARSVEKKPGSGPEPGFIDNPVRSRYKNSIPTCHAVSP